MRKDLAGRGLDTGPQTIAWHLHHHHGIRVSAATVSRYLARAGLVTPDPRKRPKSSRLRFAAQLPNECWQSHRATPASAYAARPKATPGDRTTDAHDRVRTGRAGADGELTLRANGRLHPSASARPPS